MREPTALHLAFCLAVSALAGFGCKDDDTAARDAGPDGGDTDSRSGAPTDDVTSSPSDSETSTGLAGCTFALEGAAPPPSTTAKELLVALSATGCGEAPEVAVLRDGAYFPASDQGPGAYRRYVPLMPGPNALEAVVWDAEGGRHSLPLGTVHFSETAPSATANSGYLRGTVRAENTELPIADALVYMRGVNGVLHTDAFGAFRFPTPGSGRFLVTVEKMGYTLAQAYALVRATRTTAVRTAYLVPLDKKTTRITAAAGGALENTAGDVTLNVAPGAVASDVDVSALSFPAHRSLPGALPDSSGWTQALELFPEGVRFAKPAVVRQENLNGFPPGFQVPVGYYNRDKGAWEPMVMATVSADGAWLEFSTRHFSPFNLNAAVAPREGGDEDDNSEGCQDRVVRESGSSVGGLSGGASASGEVSSWLEGGSLESLDLSYSSAAATAQGEAVVDFTVAESGDAEPVESVEVEVDVEGEVEVFTADADGEAGWIVVVDTRDKDTDTDTDTASDEPLETGVHVARVETTERAYSTYQKTPYFGGGGLGDSGVRTREALPFTSRRAIALAVQNDRESPFGVGWSLAGQERLIFNAELGYAMWTSGGRPPELIPVGLPSLDRIDLFGFGNDALLDHAYDAAGQLYFAAWDGRILRAADPAAAGAATELARISGAQQLIPWRDEMLVLDDNGGIFRLSGQSAVLLFDLRDTVDAYLEAHPILSPFVTPSLDVGMVADAGGYLWTLGTGTEFALAPFAERPVAIRLDISTPIPKVKIYTLTGLSADAAPLALAYDGLEHALYFVMSNEQVLRRFDIAAENESFVRAEKELATDGRAALVRGGLGSSYFSAEDGRLVRFSAEGVMTVLARDGADQLFGLERFVLDVAIGPGGQATFLLADEAGTQALAAADLGLGAVPDRALRLTPAGGGHELRLPGEAHRFDSAGRLTAVQDDHGASLTSYTYDAAGRLTAYATGFGSTTTFAYDASGRVNSITDPAGRARTLAYDTAGHLISLTDAGGVMTTYDYDDGSRLTRRANGALAEEYEYDASGRVLAARTSSGSQTSYESLAATAAAAGGILPLTEAVSTVVDGAGHVHETVYGAGGETVAYRLDGEEYTIARLVMPTTGEQTATVYRQGEELVSTRIDGRGRVLERRLFGARIIAEDYLAGETGEADVRYYGFECSVDPYDTYMSYSCNGESADFAPSTDGARIDVTDDSGNLWTLALDERGNTVALTDPEGSMTTLLRDAAGNIAVQGEADGRETSYTYDQAGRLKTVTDAIGASYTASYAGAFSCALCSDSGQGTPSVVTDPLAATWTAAVREDGSLASFTDPLGRAVSYGYDGNGSLTSVDAAGQSATWTRSGHGLVTQANVDGAITTYTYDHREHLVAAESADFGLTLAYDTDGATITETVNDKVTGHTQTLTRTIDPERGLDTTVTTSGGANWTLAWNYVTERILTDSSGIELSTHVGSRGPESIAAYDTLAAATLGSEDFSYDTRRRLNQISLSTAIDSQSLDYAFASAGRDPSAQTASGTLFDSAIYGYDAVGRLTSVTGPAAETFTYDDASRIASSSYAGAFVYDAASQALSTARATYTYDTAGRRTSRTDALTGAYWTYAFNALEQLVAVAKFTSIAAASPFSTVALAYDPIGRLSRVTVDGVRIHYQWYDDVLVAELDSSGALLRRYLPSFLPDGVAVVFVGNEPLFAVVDAVGSVLRLFDRSGATRAAYVYGAYGRVISATGDLALQPRRFAGALYLESLGLYYLRQRWLDPELGQFLSRDPLWQVAYQPYAYCAGRPYACTDPQGMEGAQAGAGVAGGYAGNGLVSAVLSQAGSAGKVIGAANTYSGFVTAFSGYKPGDDVHNAETGLNKIAKVTMLDRSPAYRGVMSKWNSFNDLFGEKKGKNKPKVRPPCD